MCAFLHVQMESNWAGLPVCNCRHTGKWRGTIKAVGNTDHTRQTWIHMQTPLSPLAGCGPVGEGTSGKVLNWTVRSLNHAYTTTILVLATAKPIEITRNKFETKVKRNADAVGTSDTCSTNSKQCWYLHHHHFVLLWFPKFLMFVLRHTLSTGWW